MARTAITPLKAVSPYGSGSGAGAAIAASDASNFNSFVNDGRTVLVVSNTASTTKTLKLKSSAGTQIGSTWTLPAEKTIVVGPFAAFQQFGAEVFFDTNSAEVKVVAVSLNMTAGALR